MGNLGIGIQENGKFYLLDDEGLFETSRHEISDGRVFYIKTKRIRWNQYEHDKERIT